MNWIVELTRKASLKELRALSVLVKNNNHTRMVAHLLRKYNIKKE